MNNYYIISFFEDNFVTENLLTKLSFRVKYSNALELEVVIKKFSDYFASSNNYFSNYIIFSDPFILQLPWHLIFNNEKYSNTYFHLIDNPNASSDEIYQISNKIDLLINRLRYESNSYPDDLVHTNSGVVSSPREFAFYYSDEILSKNRQIYTAQLNEQVVLVHNIINSVFDLLSKIGCSVGYNNANIFKSIFKSTEVIYYCASAHYDPIKGLLIGEGTYINLSEIIVPNDHQLFFDLYACNTAIKDLNCSTVLLLKHNPGRIVFRGSHVKEPSLLYILRLFDLIECDYTLSTCFFLEGQLKEINNLKNTFLNYIKKNNVVIKDF